MHPQLGPFPAGRGVLAAGQLGAGGIAPAPTRPRGCTPGRSRRAGGTGCGWAGPGTAHVDEVLRPDDLVVAVCDNAHEELDPDLPRLHWSIPDPVRVGTDAAFDAAYDEITAGSTFSPPTPQYVERRRGARR